MTDVKRRAVILIDLPQSSLSVRGGSTPAEKAVSVSTEARDGVSLSENVNANLS